jgi:hypothetical protein
MTSQATTQESARPSRWDASKTRCVGARWDGRDGWCRRRSAATQLGREPQVRSAVKQSSGADVFRSADERDAKRRERTAEQTRAEEVRAEQAKAAQEERERAKFLSSPVGQALTAKEAGQTFFEVQLELGKHTGSASFGTAEGRRTTSSSAATLGEIEKLGWRLEHTGYYFMITSESSSDRMFATGEATAVNGITIGVYLFRNTGPADSSY